jgi:hypothetical protein
MRFVVTVAKSTATRANAELTCASIARIAAQTLHVRSCVPTPAKSEATRVNFGKTEESFAVMFATGVATFEIIDTTGAMRGGMGQ